VNLAAAISQWTQLLGEDRVDASSDARKNYAQSTLPRGTRPAAILFPESTAEVSEIVKITARFAVPLYPISRGNNWGYGDACAATHGQVIVDLRRMNRILEVNSDLCYAVVEPGVTQQQLYEYIQSNNLPLILDVTGAGPDTSILGNTMERGFGHSPLGDHFHNSAGYEIVLADGSVLNTGFGHYANAKAANVYKPGVGPALDGIFTQSNFGIATRMAVWLLRKPECLQAFGFSVKNPEDIFRAVEILRELRLSGAVQGCVHIANDLRVIASQMQYPWEEMDGRTPLSPSLRSELRKNLEIDAWAGMSGIYGTRESVAAAKRAIRRAFKGVARVDFCDQRLLKIGQRIVKFLNRFGLAGNLARKVERAGPVFDLFEGKPSSKHLYGSAWRSRRPSAKGDDVKINTCGMMWLAPVLPATGESVRELLGLLEPVYERCGFEPLITLSVLSPRALCCVATVSFDKDNPEECRKAADCYNQLFELCVGRGYVPYRAGIQSMQALEQGSKVYWDVARQIKAALDPQNILAPGRYVNAQSGSQTEASSKPEPQMQLAEK
jgi:4-cresol dehydrogenase (hydroxylating)